MIDRATHSSAPALSRSVETAAVGPDGLTIVVEASEDQRRALGSVNGLLEVKSCVAHLRLVREGPAGIALSGTLEAVVRRSCVVTLEDFDTQIREPITLHFLPERELDALRAQAVDHHAAVSDGAALSLSEDEDPDLPDPIVRGRIDVGAVVAEFLTLSLDPYPRKPGASFPEPLDADPTVSPFAALIRLKDMKDT